jgi:hypothetical protein
VAKLVARLLARGSSLGSNQNISQKKNKMADICKGVAITASQKKIHIQQLNWEDMKRRDMYFRYVPCGRVMGGISHYRELLFHAYHMTEFSCRHIT